MRQPMSRKDNLIVWGGIYMPRIFGNITVICVSSLPSRDRNSFDPTLMYLAILSLVLNILSIASWVNPRSLSALFGAKSNSFVNDKTLFIASLAVLISECALVSRSAAVYSELTMFILISTFLAEVVHIYAVPSEWKHEPHLQDIFWQNFYVLLVFVLVFIYVCFISHLLTQGYVKPVWRQN